VRVPAPIAAGVNFAVTVQLAAEAKDPPTQLFTLIANSAALVPVIAGNTKFAKPVLSKLIIVTFAVIGAAGVAVPKARAVVLK
jgi:hypothetical protein